MLSLQASSSINNDQLILTAPTPDKVPASYKQLLRINGKKVVLQSPNHQTNSGLFFYCNDNDSKYIAVPVDDWLRTQLSNIEKFVMMKVSIPSNVPKSKEGSYVYKPLALTDTLLLTVSKWCKYFKFNKSKGGHVLLENFEQFERGQYNFNIEVAHVYIGPHKGGQNFSLSLRVTQITYKEDESYSSHFDDEVFADVLDSTPPQATPQKKKKTEKRAMKLSKLPTVKTC